MADQNNTNDIEKRIAILTDTHRYDGYEFPLPNEPSLSVENGRILVPGKEPIPIAYIGGITRQRYYDSCDSLGLDPIVCGVPEDFPDSWPIPLLLGEPVEPHKGGLLVVGLPDKHFVIRPIDRIEKPV